jgi:hypothetical protein
VAPQDAGVASATVTVAQQLGASIGTSLVNTIFASAVASYVSTHATSAGQAESAAAHGYDTAFWWIAGIFTAGALIAGALLPRGALSTAAVKHDLSLDVSSHS